MQGTNRVAPLITDVHPAKYAAVTIVTQVDVLRHVEILPVSAIDRDETAATAHSACSTENSSRHSRTSGNRCQS